MEGNRIPLLATLVSHPESSTRALSLLLGQTKYEKEVDPRTSGPWISHGRCTQLFRGVQAFGSTSVPSSWAGLLFQGAYRMLSEKTALALQVVVLGLGLECGTPTATYHMPRMKYDKTTSSYRTRTSCILGSPTRYVPHTKDVIWIQGAEKRRHKCFLAQGPQVFPTTLPRSSP